MAKKGNLGFEQLKRDLKEKAPRRFYILYGEEDYLRRYYYEELRKQLLDELTADFNFHHMTTENFSLQQLSDSIEALPMMAERSLILLEEIDLFALPEGDREHIMGLVSDLPEHCCLVLTYESFKPDKRKKKLWDVLEKNACMVEFSYRDESELRPWILRHFRSNRKEIDPALCTYLMSRCGVSMTRLHGEISKICAYSGADVIVREDIDAVAEPTLEAVVFEISDAIGQGRFETALERLHTLLKLQTEPIPILGAIGTQMRRLHAAKVLQSCGKGADALMRIYGLQSFVANGVIAQSRRVSEDFCRQAVLRCLRADHQIKTSYADPKDILELLILQLAQEAKHA